MIYTFLSSVFITIFLILGTWSFFGFNELRQGKYPLGWTCYQHVIVLAIVAVVCFILAVIFGIQIPNGYVR